MATDPDTFHTVADRIRREPDPIKGSRHIATLAPTATPEDAKSLIEEIRADSPGANHHAWAYRLRGDGLAERCSDDGEPSGTAGRPILRQLELRGLWNCTLVVTRFFGGTKLGSGGLVRAYGGAAAAVLEDAEVLAIVPERQVRIRVSYPDEPLVHRLLAEAGQRPDRVEHGAAVEFHLVVREPEIGPLQSELTERTRGRAESFVSDRDRSLDRPRH